MIWMRPDNVLSWRDRWSVERNRSTPQSSFVRHRSPLARHLLARRGLVELPDFCRFSIPAGSRNAQFNLGGAIAHDAPMGAARSPPTSFACAAVASICFWRRRELVLSPYRAANISRTGIQELFCLIAKDEQTGTGSRMFLKGLILVPGLPRGLSERECCAARDQYHRHQMCLHDHLHSATNVPNALKSTLGH